MVFRRFAAPAARRLKPLFYTKNGRLRRGVRQCVTAVTLPSATVGGVTTGSASGSGVG